MQRTGVLAIASMLVAVLLMCIALTQHDPAVAESAVRVSASRSAHGTSAAGLLAARRGAHVTWRSTGPARGAWVQTDFSRATVVDASTLTGAGRALRIVEGRLQFSDGSVVAVHTDGGGSRTVVFSPRAVRWVRLVVTRVATGQRAVGLARWTVRRSPAHLVARPKGDAATLAAAHVSTGRPGGTRWTATGAGPGQWLRLTWRRPVEISAVQIAGGAADASGSIRAASLEFSDGSTVGVGTLEPRGGAPTTIAFTPRTVTSVRFRVTSIASGAHASLRRLSVYAVGSRPPMPSVGTPTFRATAAAATSCSGVHASGSSTALRLLCPSNGSRSASVARLVLAGPAGASLSVDAFLPHGSGGRVATIARGTVDSHGTARLAISTRSLAHGPTAVRITSARVKTPLYVQIVNASGVTERAASSAPARGMDLKYDEEFTQPLSVTRSGAAARYASGKPNGYGVDDFGDAIFAQPTASNGNLSTVGGYLRIRSSALRAGQVDPAGYGRRSVGGLVSSAHMGGSGFSAQYGYFEARMLGPAGAGTWPAFWLLSTGSLYGRTSSTAEVDAVELYGANASGACQSTHNWVRGANVNGKAFCGPLQADADWALQWHTYGARVTPTGTDFYIDGVHTSHTSAMVDNDQSFFFIVNLALGGGWPVNLSGTRSKVDLYVDSIRVWV